MGEKYIVAKDRFQAKGLWGVLSGLTMHCIETLMKAFCNGPSKLICVDC